MPQTEIDIETLEAACGAAVTEGSSYQSAKVWTRPGEVSVHPSTMLALARAYRERDELREVLKAQESVSDSVIDEMKHRADTAIAELAALRSELDALKADKIFFKDLCQDLEGERDEARAERDALKAALETAEKALAPIPLTLRGHSYVLDHAQLDLSYSHLAEIKAALAAIRAALSPTTERTS